MTNQRAKFIAFINALPEEELVDMVHLGKQLGYNPNQSNQTDGYKPEDSHISEDALVDFLRAPLIGELTEVPGIGPKMAKQLAKGDDPIINTYQMFGKFLTLKSNNQETKEPIDCPHHCDKFWQWLKAKGIDSHRSGIVMAIAEKTNTMIPGIYDADDFNWDTLHLDYFFYLNR